ncbi:MAG: hypothetical protein ACKO5O_03145 [Cylindrospermopsis raciborskii]
MDNRRLGLGISTPLRDINAMGKGSQRAIAKHSLREIAQHSLRAIAKHALRATHVLNRTKALLNGEIIYPIFQWFWTPVHPTNI